mmetsp:Transcript_5026/g.22470  ORF Transcript_5026/g.22470 Transcript_5026/m.22470 type:complete len:264 (+) Transcript_5026:262-1053(+)
MPRVYPLPEHGVSHALRVHGEEREVLWNVAPFRHLGRGKHVHLDDLPAPARAAFLFAPVYRPVASQPRQLLLPRIVAPPVLAHTAARAADVHERRFHRHDVPAHLQFHRRRRLHPRHPRVDVTAALNALAVRVDHRLLRLSGEGEHGGIGFDEDGGEPPTREVVGIGAEEAVVGADVDDEGREAGVRSCRLVPVPLPGRRRSERLLVPPVDPRRLAAVAHVNADGHRLVVHDVKPADHVPLQPRERPRRHDRTHRLSDPGALR